MTLHMDLDVLEHGMIIKMEKHLLSHSGANSNDILGTDITNGPNDWMGTCDGRRMEFSPTQPHAMMMASSLTVFPFFDFVWVNMSVTKITWFCG